MLSEDEVRELLAAWMEVRRRMSGKSHISFFVDGVVESLEQVLAGGKE